jgi:OOP family OmpA-OmpF porin
MNLPRAFVIAAVAAVVLPNASLSQDYKAQGYVTESLRDGSVVTSGTGLCWRTSVWSPEQASEPCDPTAGERAQAPTPAEEPATPAPEQAAVESTPEPEAARVAPAETETEAAVSQPTPSEPEPAPAAAQEPEPRITSLPQTVNYSADTFFDFDDFVLRPEGKAKLDQLARELQNVNYQSILVVGHTDRIGTAEYNQTLSERRARVVKRYLAAKGVPDEAIRTEGKGQSEPTTKPNECRGPKSPHVVACLQPDRRVDIEVAGTKVGDATGSR